MTATYSTAIIGAGPAGIAASIQLARGGTDFVIFEKGSMGGLLNNAFLVENYPGFPDGISGPELVKLFKRQFDKYAIELIKSEVEKVDYKDCLFRIETAQRVFMAVTLIVASGSSPRPLESAVIDAGAMERIFYEITPIIDETGKNVAIIGGGDTACDYALNLARQNKIFLIQRNSESRCAIPLAERARIHSNITRCSGYIIKNIVRHSDGRLGIECAGHPADTFPPFDYVVIGIGRNPCDTFLSYNIMNRMIELESDGLLHRIGDVANGRYRQTAIACGDGLLAAMKIHEKLRDSIHENNRTYRRQ